MHLRKMVLADYAEIYALWLSCTGMGLNDLDDSQNGIGRFLKRNPDTCFLPFITAGGLSASCV